MKSIWRGMLLGVFLATSFAVGTADTSASGNCPFTAGGNKTVVYFESSVGRLYSRDGYDDYTRSRGWKTYKDVNLPTTLAAGQYKISLAAYDEYSNRVNVSQPYEYYYVMFKNAGGSTIASTGKSGELPDNRVRGEWSGSVGTITLNASSSKIRVRHARDENSHPGNYANSPNSLNPSCMLIEKVSTPTPSIDNGSCIVEDTKFLRYGKSYSFDAGIRNGSNTAVYVTNATRHITNEYFLDKGGDFAPTYALTSRNYKLNSGDNIKYVATTGNWRVKSKPSSRTNATASSYDFKIEYKANYNANSKTASSSDKTSRRCEYYSVTWCGDGVRDAGYEVCDPNDSSRTGWGNSGCSNTCEPINLDPEAVCDSLSVDDTTIHAPGNVDFTCSGRNVDSTRVTCGNGQTVNSATGTCSYPHAGTYEMVCTMTGGGVSVTSPSCKKTITVNSNLNPAIQIEKTALDGSDIQTVGSSNTARFKIRVKNVGNESLARNIILTDSLSPNCGGTLVLPNNHPSSFANFRYYGEGNHDNQILEPGEEFEYTCEKSNVTSDFTNVVSVNGTGTNSGNSVSDSDTSKVQKQEVQIEIPACPYTATGNGFVVNLIPAGRLWSMEGQLNRGTITLPRSYEAGKYKIRLFAADAYQTRVSRSQPREIIKINIQNNGTTLATSNSTSDLEDNVAIAYVDEIVNQALMVGASFNQIEVVHGAFPDNTSANSVQPVCGLIEKIETPNPSIKIDKTDMNSEQDIDGQELNDTQTILVGHTSRFKITVTNDGTESLKNIIISDDLAPNCAGSVSLPGIYPSNWSNFSIVGNNDQYLDPGESFSYKCTRPNTLDSYVNTASVRADGKDSNTGVTDADISPVVVDTDADEDVCPYTPTGGQILIEFNDWTLGDWKTEVRSHLYTNFGTIPKGRYRISLAAFDGYKDRSNPQPEEQYYVVFRRADGTEVSRTNVTQDIRDDSNNAAWYGVVNTDFFLSEDVRKLSTDHKNQTASGKYNSLKAKCMLLDPIGETGEPAISIVKEDANSDDQDGGAYDTQTVAPNGDAVFKIKVTNSGTEDLRDIVITDALAPNCAGSVTLPSTAPSTFTNFVEDGNGDDVFNPGETFEYTCTAPNTTDDYTNVAGVTAVGVDSGESVDDNDASLVKLGGVQGPSIIVDKLDENLSDIDDTVGDDTQTVAPEARAVFKIRVTNNGTEDLTNIELTDALAPNCSGSVTLPGQRPTSFKTFVVAGQGDHTNDVLEPAEYFEYTCVKGNTTADYTNSVTVNAEGATTGESVDSTDTTEVLVDPQPSVSIDKRDANSEDLDRDIGDDTQSILSGDTAVFKIRVTNNGYENLTNIKVIDELAPNCSVNIELPVTSMEGREFSAGGSGDYDNTVLEPGEWVEYTCTKENVTEGFTNEASVEAEGETSGEGVTDTDTTPVIVEDPNPSVRIIKRDGNPDDLDGDVADSQTVESGSPAVFTIVVINNGNEDLTDISVVDAVAPQCGGQVTLPDTVPSTWTSFVILGDGDNTNNVLEPGERFRYNCSKLNTTQGYTNTAGVNAKGTESGETVTDEDTSKVRLAGPDISIDKTDENPDDRDIGIDDSQAVDAGSDSVFRITVTNTGTEGLTSVAVQDVLAPNCGGQVTLPGTYPSTFEGFVLTGNDDDIFDPEESFTYTCSKANTTEAYTNTAAVTGEGVESGTVVNDQDDSEVLLSGPNIEIIKSDANPDDSDGGADDTQTVASGARAVFSITVRNTGTSDLTNIVITDTLAPNCGGQVTLPSTVPSTFSGFTVNGNGDDVLNPGESFTYTCEQANTTEGYTNTASVEAEDPETGNPVDDDDTSVVVVEGPSIKITKEDNNPNVDTDGSIGNDTQTVAVGEDAVFKITVENNGTEGLTNIVITDAIEARCAGTVTLPNTVPDSFRNFLLVGNGDNVFDPGESFSYDCVKDNTTQNYTNTAGAEGTGVTSGEKATDEDTTEVVIPQGVACNGLTVVDATGEPTHTTDMTCTGTNVETFEIDCGNGQVFTGSGSNSGSETFTRTCTYTAKDNYTATCKINDEITNNSCEKLIVVSDGGSTSGGGGGSTGKCILIDIENTSTASSELVTDITCSGTKSKVKKFRLDLGNGETIIRDTVDGEVTFTDVVFRNTTNGTQQYNVSCQASTKSDPDDDDFDDRLVCKDRVNVGPGNPTGGGNVCGNGKIENYTDSFGNTVNEECEAVVNENGQTIISLPSATCNADCTLKPSSSSGGGGGGGSSSSSGGGGSTGRCGDGVIQSPNSNGQFEVCERILKLAPNGINYILEDFPSTCSNTCQHTDYTKIGDKTIPGNIDLEVNEGRNVIIGHNQDVFSGPIGKPYIINRGPGRIILDQELCVHNVGDTSILTGGSMKCTPTEIGLLKPGQRFEVDVAGAFRGTTSNHGNDTYKDTKLVTSYKDYPVSYLAYDSEMKVRVAKPSVATTGGGISLMKEANTSGKVSDVSELATEGFSDEDNTNFQGASVSDEGSALSSSSTTSSSSDVNDQADTDATNYDTSTSTVDAASAATTDTSLPTDGNFYNGIDDVYLIDGNLELGAGQGESLTQATTYIVNGDLIINEDIDPSKPIAFIVKGGDVKIAGEVKSLKATIVNMGGKIKALDGTTQNQLVIEGGVYGDKSDLIQNRTYISNEGGDAGQISVGTIVRRGAALFSETPPLLRSFIDEYTDETAIAQ